MKKTDRYLFPAVFTYEDGQISITFPDLPGCVSCADTEEEALKNAQEAMGGHLFFMEQDGDAIPAWMNAAAMERGINFSQVLQAALMEQMGIVRIP